MGDAVEWEDLPGDAEDQQEVLEFDGQSDEELVFGGEYLLSE
jgi:hypothetical protein